jgi:hypothetical protein
MIKELDGFFCAVCKSGLVHFAAIPFYGLVLFVLLWYNK